MYNKNNNYKKAMTHTKSEHVKDILNFPYANLSHRGIRADICQMFNVRMAVSEADGKTPTAIYFPFYSKQKKLSGWKKKNLLLDKSDDFYITTIGAVGTACLLFGQLEAEKINRKRSKLIMVEGEEDLLASVQACIDSLSNTKFKGMAPFAVSLSCGCANAAEACVQNIEFIRSFETVHLGFDNDHATDKERRKGICKGQEATEAVGTTLLTDNIMVVEYPEGIKDPNDMLIEKRGKELATLLSFPTKKFSAEKVVKASAISFDEVMEEMPWGVTIDAFPLLMKKIKGFRQRELTIITSLVGAGKSSITAEVAYGLGSQNKRVGMIFLEETKKETFQRMMSRHLHVNYNHFKFNPSRYANQDQLREAYEWVQKDDKYVFLDHFGSILIEDLMNKVRSLYYIDKVDFIILDHLTMCVSGVTGANTDDRKMLDVVMTELAAFCASHDIGIIAVSHLNRSVAEEMKGKSNTEPYWIKVRKEQLRGSSGLEALSWTILGLDVEILPNGERGRVRLSVLKNRPCSYLGECDIIRMDDRTGLLENAADEVYEA